MDASDTAHGDRAAGSAALMPRAAEALLGYLAPGGALDGPVARFPLPADRVERSPLAAAPPVDVDVEVHVDGVAAGTRRLRCGAWDFEARCEDSWRTPADTPCFGRVCVEGTRAPMFSGFAHPDADRCARSDEPFDATRCDESGRAFFVAVR